MYITLSSEQMGFPSSDEKVDTMQLEVPEQLLRGPCGEIVFATAVSMVKKVVVYWKTSL